MSLLIRILLALAVATALVAARAAEPIVVGASAPLTGYLAERGREYRNALELWRDQTNAAGGLLGRPVRLRLYDDASDALRARLLYAKLIEEDRVDLLIGPLGSAATLTAASQAEAARRVLINASGALPRVHRRPWSYVFQTAIPAAAHGIAVVALMREHGLRSAFVLARDDAVSREQAEAARQAALAQGLAVPEVIVYPAGLRDFDPLVQQAAAVDAQALLAFGAEPDSAQLVFAMKKQGWAPQLFFASAANDPKFISLVGQDAEHTLATREYEAHFRTTGNASFADAYREKWSATPGVNAAEAYAAATVLGEAVRRAGTLEQETLRETLLALEMDTVLGGYRVHPETGAQLAARPAIVQIQRGKPAVVWPERLQSAQREPYPAWDERRYLR